MNIKTSTNGTSNPLSANYNFEENEVYQISLKLVDKLSGSVTPKIGSELGQYSHSIEGTTTPNHHRLPVCRSSQTLQLLQLRQ